MSTITTTIQFAPTPLTEDQLAIRNTYLAEQLAAGLLITEDPTDFDVQPALGVRVWATEDAANAYMVWCNTAFGRPPSISKLEIT